MASSKVVEAVKEILTCSICLEEAVDPRALSCQHTYCLNCLKLYSSTDDNKKSLEQNKKIPCPTCRNPCPVSDGRIEGLPTSFIFSQLKDATGSRTHDVTEVTGKGRTSVGMCSSSECADEVAVSYCKTCDYVCCACADDHKTVRILKKHKLISLDEAAQMIRDRLPACPDHPEQTLQLYCEQCKIPLCFVCHALKHAQHRCEAMKNKVSNSKDELNIILEQTGSMLKESERTAKTIQCKFAKQEHTFKSTIREAASAADALREDVTRNENKIKTEVERIWKSRQKILEEENGKISSLQKSLNQILKCEEKLRKNRNPCDYVSRVPSLKIQLMGIKYDISDSFAGVDLSAVKRMISDMKVNYIIHNM